MNRPSTRLRFGLVALLVGGAPAAAGAVTPPVLEGLTQEETEALRKGLYRVDPIRHQVDEETAVMEAVVQATPSLTDGQRQRIRAHARRHPETWRAVQEILDVRLNWRRRVGEAFTFWWTPRIRGRDGLPGRPPTRAEEARLERVAVSTAELFGLPEPRWMPFRLDPRLEEPRAHPRSDLRWAITSDRPHVPDIVAQAVLLDIGQAPYLMGPLGVLHGTCHDNDACRDRVLRQARDTVVDAGYVGVIDGLGAGALAGRDDPAFASGLLVVDHLERRVGVEPVARLLRGSRPGLEPAELVRVVRAALGVGPRQLDRAVLRELKEGYAEGR